MYEETVTDFQFEQFVESTSMPGMMDDLEMIREENPTELTRDNRGFLIAGVISALAGVGLFLGMNAGALGLSSLMPSENWIPAVVMGGVAALGYGLIKGFRKVFRRKNLNLPSLQIRRKTPKSIEARRQQSTAPRTRTFSASEAYRPNNKLAKSKSDKVFLGVAGGLAKHSGISSSLIRLAFIAAFAITGGSAALIYMALGLFLPNEVNTLPPRPGQR